MALTTDIVAYYKLDETSGTTASDELSTYDGTVTNATRATGKIDNCLDFDGSGDYLTIPDIGEPDEITISVRAKSDNSTAGTGNANGLFHTDMTTSARNNGLQINEYNGIVYLDICTSTQNQYINTGITSSERTNRGHYVLTYKVSTKAYALYLNNTLKVSGTATYGVGSNWTGVFRFGVSYALSAGTPNRFYNGLIDEIGIRERLLTTDEIEELYNDGDGLQYPFTSPPSPSYTANESSRIRYRDISGITAVDNVGQVISFPTTGCVSYYKLDESSGDAADSAGSYTGTNSNVTYSAAKINNGGVFNGSTSSISASSGTFGTTATVSCWVYISSAITSWRGIMSLGTNRYTGNRVLTLYITSSNKLVIGDNYGGTELITGTSAPIGQRFHLVGKLVSGDVELYLNGNSIGSKTGSININQTGIYLGRGAVADYHLGGIDEVGIWNRELTTDEITILYNGGVGRTY